MNGLALRCTRLANTRRTLTVIALTTAALACSGNGAIRSAEARAADQLVGTWDATITLTDSDGKTSQPVHGTIALVQDHYGHASSPQTASVVDYGAYDIDFRTFGFDPRDGESIPSVVAGVSEDSADGRLVSRVRMILHPGQPRVAVILDGVLTGDAISGQWQTDSRTAAGAGKFTLTRHRP